MRCSDNDAFARFRIDSRHVNCAERRVGNLVTQSDLLEPADRAELDTGPPAEPSGLIALIAGALSGASVMAMIWLLSELIF